MSKLYKYYTVGLLTLASMFLYADQNLISPNLSAVAEDFGFDEREKAGRSRRERRTASAAPTRWSFMFECDNETWT